MTPSCKSASGTAAALDYNSTLIGALELSSKKWVFAVQLPGSKKHTRHVVELSGPALMELIERLKARSLAAGRPILRTLLAWLRGEPRVCSMVPIPSEADEEARRAHREREDLTGLRLTAR